MLIATQINRAVLIRRMLAQVGNEAPQRAHVVVRAPHRAATSVKTSLLRFGPTLTLSSWICRPRLSNRLILFSIIFWRRFWVAIVVLN